MKKLLLVLAIAILAVATMSACDTTHTSAVEDTIVSSACAEMGIAPERTELHLLHQEYVAWLGCNTYTYALVADGAVYIVGVNGNEDEVRYVDVIEEVDRVPTWEEYAGCGDD